MHRDPLRIASRAVRRRPDPGRRGDVDQSERQRGDREQGARTARAATRRLSRAPPARTRQPRTEHQRRLPHCREGGARNRRPWALGRTARTGGRMCRQGSRIRRHAQTRTYATARCRADDAGAGVRRVRGHHRRGRRQDGRGYLAHRRDQSRRHRDRHRTQRPPVLRRAGMRTPATAHRSAADHRGRSGRSDVGRRLLRATLRCHQTCRGEAVENL